MTSENHWFALDTISRVLQRHRQPEPLPNVPPFSSSGSSAFAVSIGIAKAMPTLPPLPPDVTICELIPITCPCTFSSGPPELRGLMGGWVGGTLVFLPGV